jgi:hypothetical protein
MLERTAGKREAGQGRSRLLYIGPSARISPVVTDPGNRPHARSEITIGPLTTFQWVECGTRLDIRSPLLFPTPYARRPHHLLRRLSGEHQPGGYRSG